VFIVHLFAKLAIDLITCPFESHCLMLDIVLYFCVKIYFAFTQSALCLVNPGLCHFVAC